MAVNIGGKKVNVGGGGKKRDLLAPTMYPARLAQAIYVGMQDNVDYNTKKDVVEDTFIFTFEFPTEKVDVNGELLPRWISRSVKISDYEKSNFFKICNALKAGGEYNPEEDDPFGFVGLACMVTIAHTATGKEKVASVNPAVSGFPVPELEGDAAFFSVSTPDMTEFFKLPEWVQKICTKNKEFAGSDLEKLLSEDDTPPFDV